MLYLCRHGQTGHNAEQRLQGQLDTDLSPLGLRQAAAMADLLHDLIARDPPAPWRIVASPLRRARMTAEAIGERLGLAVETDARLKEIGVGAWEGRLRSDLLRETPGLTDDPEWLFTAPGGERFDALRGRIEGWLAEQAPEPERRLIVVSHGVSGRMLRMLYGTLPRAGFAAMPVPQDAIWRLADGQVDRLDCAPVEAI